jgi:uncharacterized membrane protein
MNSRKDVLLGLASIFSLSIAFVSLLNGAWELFIVSAIVTTALFFANSNSRKEGEE